MTIWFPTAFFSSQSIGALFLPVVRWILLTGIIYFTMDRLICAMDHRIPAEDQFDAPTAEEEEVEETSEAISSRPTGNHTDANASAK